MDSPKADSTAGNISESPFDQQGGRRAPFDCMDSPAMRIAAGVASAATIGSVGRTGWIAGRRSGS
jgi:hypothetical protein